MAFFPSSTRCQALSSIFSAVESLLYSSGLYQRRSTPVCSPHPKAVDLPRAEILKETFFLFAALRSKGSTGNSMAAAFSKSLRGPLASCLILTIAA